MKSWDDVRFFLEVARCGNVSGASRALGVNHSTVSRRIQAFESAHGVRLFERLASGYELTEEGMEIFELAHQLEEKNHNLARKLQGRDTRLAGKIKITMPHDIFDFLLAKYLADFMVSHPEIHIEMQVAKGIKNLSARESDIAVRLTPAPPESLVGREVCKLQHAIYQNPSLVIEESTPIVTWIDETGIPRWANALHNPKVVLQVDDLCSMYAAVKNAMGVARMPCYYANLLDDQCVAALPLEIPLSSWGIWVLNHVDLKKTARVKKCREFLISALSEHQHIFSQANVK